MSRKNRGFTLIELIVGIFIGVTITTAALAFIRHETRLMGATSDRLQVVQSGRAVMDLITNDLRQAGLGMGTDPTGNFPGILVGNFTLNGIAFGDSMGLTLEESRVTGSVAYATTTMDLGIRKASGDQATIVDITGIGTDNGQVQVCNSPGLEYRNDELVLFQDEYLQASLGVRLLNPVGPTGDCPCLNPAGLGQPCLRFVWERPSPMSADAETWASDAGAPGTNFANGQVYGNYRTLVYFVDQSDSLAGRSALRRVDFSELPPGCSGRDDTCGALVARNVEGLFYAVETLDPAVGTWTPLPPATPIPPDVLVRVDVELVLRNENRKDTPQPAVTPQLGGGVRFPPAGQDLVEREVYRTSVQIRNAGLGVN